MEFKVFNRKALQEFIESEEFLHMPFIPITHHRAISQLRNPRAEEKDVLLILAMEADQMAGYLGILPDLFYGKYAEPRRAGWLSCLWVHPTFRGRGLGGELIRHALERWDRAVVFAEYVPWTVRLYERSGAFCPPVILDGIRVYVRMDLGNILPPRHTIFRRLKPLLKLFDLGFNMLLDRRFILLRHRTAGIAFESLVRVDEETARFIHEMNGNDLCRRGDVEINWMLEYPWIVQNSPERESDARYYFSSAASCFGCHAFRLRRNDGTIGAFFILSLRDHTLKMPVYHARPEMVGEVARIIAAQIIKWKVNTFTTFQPDLAGVLSRSSPGILTRRIRRRIMVSRAMESYFIAGAVIQDGEGDLAFT